MKAVVAAGRPAAAGNSRNNVFQSETADSAHAKDILNGEQGSYTCGLEQQQVYGRHECHAPKKRHARLHMQLVLPQKGCMHVHGGSIVSKELNARLGSPGSQGCAARS